MRRRRIDWMGYLYIAPAFGLALLFSFFSMAGTIPMSSLASRPPWGFLIAAVVLAAGAQRLRLGERNTADPAEERVHDEGSREAQPEKRAPHREAHVGEPVEPFEKIIRMPRVAP